MVVVLFLGSGTLHLLRPGVYEPIVPHVLPAPAALVVISGLVELACAIGLLVPSCRRVAGCASALLLVAIFPANVQMLLNARAAGASPSTEALLWARLPLQLAVIAWTLAVSRPRRGGRAAAEG